MLNDADASGFKKVLVFYRLPVLFVNETDNPAGNLPNCTKMPMTQNLADL